MYVFHKRRIIGMLLAFLFSFFSFSCLDFNHEKPPENTPNIGIQFNINNFHAVFIDVGYGDSTLLHFPDGTNVLIDCGAGEEALLKVKDVFKQFSIQSLDVFILTNVLENHIGNAEYIIKNYDVKKLFIPDIIDSSIFPTFSKVLSLSQSLNINTERSSTLKNLVGENYLLLFLTPKDSAIEDSPYNELNFSTNISDAQIKNISPILYVEYMGVNMVLGGDCDIGQEKVVIEYNKINYYKHFIEGFELNLEKIDLYKLQNHGDSNSNSEDFMSLLAPKNAVLSVNGNNNYSHPSTSVLTRLFTASPNCKLLRTDTVGNITFEIDAEGNYTFNGE